MVDPENKLRGAKNTMIVFGNGNQKVLRKEIKQ